MFCIWGFECCEFWGIVVIIEGFVVIIYVESFMCCIGGGRGYCFGGFCYFVVFCLFVFLKFGLVYFKLINL